MYDYQKIRNASHPRTFLKDFSGICVTDGYQVYYTVEKQLEELTIAGCWVHARRRFDEALKLVKENQKKSDAYMVMKQIQAIYREEGKLKDLTSEERLSQRQVIIKPLVDALFVYLKRNKATVSKKTKLGEAYTYILNQEKICCHGHQIFRRKSKSNQNHEPRKWLLIVKVLALVRLRCKYEYFRLRNGSEGYLYEKN